MRILFITFTVITFSIFVIIGFITPPTSTVSKERSSSKQESFRKKLLRRSKARPGLQGHCQICNDDARESGLQAAHLLPHAARHVQEEKYVQVSL